jgi:hypothetical protein
VHIVPINCNIESCFMVYACVVLHIMYRALG